MLGQGCLLGLIYWGTIDFHFKMGVCQCPEMGAKAGKNWALGGAKVGQNASKSTFYRVAPVRFDSVTVWEWKGSSGSGFRFRRFL